MELDKDLFSIQEARNLAKLAKEAQEEYKHFNQAQVDKVVKAIVDAGYAAADKLARLAVEETGFGIVEDKIVKNQFGTKNIWESIKDLKTVGVISIEKNGRIVKIAEPMGVVAALIPSTNPTSTMMFKTIISLKARNGIVASPHPKAVRSVLETAKIISEAAEKAGAPKGLIQCLTTPTLQSTDALMKDKNIAIILATGSNQMVKAAYSAGKPAYGVGAGNVPAFIERTADYKKAVADIILGTTFDNGTICSSEQAIIVDRPLHQQVVAEVKARGGYFVKEEEKIKLEKAMVVGGGINPECVGKSATFIAKYAGFDVPGNTTVLVVESKKVGKEEPLSLEKLSPVLSFYVVDGWLEGCHKCIELLEYGGIGHTMVIHSNDKEIIMKFALEKPAFRILVNTPTSLGAIGYTTELEPSLTLGCGTWGGSIVSENVSARHLINIKTLAFEVNPQNKGNAVNSLDGISFSKTTNGSTAKSFTEQIEENLRARAGNVNVNPFNISKKESSEGKKSQFGEGITEEEIQRIIREFKG